MLSVSSLLLLLLILFLTLSLQVEIFADTASGYVNIVTSGGNGKRGQDGANGRKGADSLGKVCRSNTIQRKQTIKIDSACK